MPVDQASIRATTCASPSACARRSATGLILRAKVLNDQKHVIEQYTFTELKLGAAGRRAAT